VFGVCDGMGTMVQGCGLGHGGGPWLLYSGSEYVIHGLDDDYVDC
jgi:hypothetical protein